MEPPEPDPHPSLMLGLLELGASIVKGLDVESLGHPPLKVVPEGFSVPHVPHSTELVDPLSSMLHLLLLSGRPLDVELVCQVLVIIHDVFCLKHHLLEHRLVLLPS